MLSRDALCQHCAVIRRVFLVWAPKRPIEIDSQVTSNTLTTEDFLAEHNSLFVLMGGNASAIEVRIDQLAIRKIDSARVAILGWGVAQGAEDFLSKRPPLVERMKVCALTAADIRSLLRRMGASSGNV